MARSAPAFPVSERSRGRRRSGRVAHDHAAVWAILDAQPLAHVGYVIDGEPFVTPTLCWRREGRVFWHGSAASRFLRRAEGTRVCLTVSLMDGYVLARSAFNHSVNYRSAMLFGVARRLERAAEKAEALEAMVEGLFPGRWPTLRPMTARELRATSVLWMDVEEASAKSRSGPPLDTDEAGFPVWAGVLPILQRPGAPEADPAGRFEGPAPAGVLDLVRRGRLRGG